MNVKRFLALVLGLVMMASCASAQEEREITVLCSLFAPYDFARAIAAGTNTRVEMLMKPGVESHAFDPSPADILRIQGADLFIYIGGESEIWADRMLTNIAGSVNTLKLLDCLTVVEEEIVAGMQVEAPEETTEIDEHIWTSPLNAVEMSEAITRALCEIDLRNETIYRENLEAYCEALNALNEEFRAIVDDAKRHEIIFADRFPFRYFVDAYGLTYYAAFPGCSTETEPSASTLKFLIDTIRKDSIPVVFHIEQGNVRMANVIAQETGAKVMQLHSCHTITKEDVEAGKTYLDFMHDNARALSIALNEEGDA